MLVKDLEGAELDYWVGQVEGIKVDLIIDDEHLINGCYHLDGNDYAMQYSPSTNWQQGGGLIEKYRVELNTGCTGDHHWLATIFNYGSKTSEGLIVAKERDKSILVAAMRCIVASKYGDEVEA